MSLDNVGLFRVMNERMNWLSQRQNVLAENVAKADMPDAKPKDLKPFSFADALKGNNSTRGSVSPSRTNDAHIAFKSEGTARAKEVGVRTIYETAPDGNGIILEEQMLQASQNAMEYQTLMGLYKKHFDLIMNVTR